MEKVLLLNFDVTLDEKGNVTSATLQPDRTKGRVYALIDVENQKANAAFDANPNKTRAEEDFTRQGLLQAQQTIARSLTSKNTKALLQAQLAALADAVIVDQVP